MNLPPLLETAIEAELAGNVNPNLTSAAESLTIRYRKGLKKPGQQYMSADADRLAYIAYRMPATYAVVSRVLAEMLRWMPECSPKSLLDLGSGPGTALWASMETLPSLRSLTAIEYDHLLIAMGKRLNAFSDQSPLQHTDWKQQDLCQLTIYPQNDLIIASYALGELPQSMQSKLASLAWEATAQALILIEPGTPLGYQRILAARSLLIDAGAFIVAPCPHASACPLSGSNWCHFSQRLARSSLHRHLKGASLGHEDEKYSYLIAAKQPFALGYEGRILRHPQKHSGHLSLELCTAEGVREKVISRRDGALYKQARKLEWGDPFS